MSLPKDNTPKKLEILYDEQSSLLERLQIHQRNLHFLLDKKANYGLDLPLPVFNEIKQQEDEILKARKRIKEIDREISKLILLSNKDKPQSTGGTAMRGGMAIDGVNYSIEVPFPFLRVESTMGSTKQIYTKAYYVGGFEVHTVLDPGKGMNSSFYVHGRRAAPLLDVQNKKLIISPGYSIILPSVISNYQKVISDKDITPESLAKGRWTVLSPAAPESSISIVDYPPGTKNAFYTTKVIYEGNYELWYVHSDDNISGIRLWFYEQDWNVAPVMNNSRLSVAFPKQPHHEEVGGK